jgi:hypothetical protein
MKMIHFFKPWHQPTVLARDTPVQSDRPRAFPVLPAVLVLVLLVAPSAGGQPVDAADVAAVGQHAVRLPGVRPDEPLDLSGYVQVPYSAALNPTGGEITIEAWVKRDGTGRYETIVGNGFKTSYWLGFSSTGRLRFQPSGLYSAVDSDSIVRRDAWTHVALTYDGMTRHFYINGVLDKTSTLNSGPIMPTSGSPSLGIGFDRDDLITPNYFGGWIDNLRIWNTVRSGSEIRGGMFQSLGASHPGLLAEWPFDGDASDPAGGHDGVPIGQATFGNEGAIPHDVRIPQVAAAPTLGLDGFCRAEEYVNATKVTLDGTEVWLMHTDTDMWICFDDLTSSSTSAMVYLDPPHTRLDPAQSEHLLLQVEEDGSTEAKEGLGTGNYTGTTAADGLWDATYQVCCGEFPTYRAEFRIDGDLLGGWSHVIGLALSKYPRYIVPGQTIIPFWPALARNNLPSTWSSSALGGISDPRTFSGQVAYQPRDTGASPVGVAGAGVNLIGSDPGGGQALVGTVESNLSGSFSLTTDDDYTEHRLELGGLPRGYEAMEAAAPDPGVSIDARTLDYGSAPPGSYPGNTFTLGDALPYVVDTQHGPYLLIVAPQQVIHSGALDEFVDFKVRQGFSVGVESVEWIQEAYPGSNRLEKIRALEQDRLSALGSRFHYVMLVGPHGIIPFAHISMVFNGKDGNGDRDLDACLAAEKDQHANALGVEQRYTDWPYADLVSDFDSNGNGCLLDGILVSSKHLPLAEGYEPDQKPALQADVSVGRIPFRTPEAVRTALANSIRFEAQSQAFKLRALHAMSFIYLEGMSWAPPDVPAPDGGWVPCPSAYEGWSHNCTAGYTDDASHLTERIRDDFLNALGYQSTILYEDPKPPVACPVVSPQPLTGGNVLAALEAHDFGLVNASGHGGAGGMGRRQWVDENGNGSVDSPTEPLPPDQKSQEEIIGPGALLDRNGLNTLTPDDGHGAVYMVDSCATGDPFDEGSFGATLLEGGHGVAWIGQLSSVGSNVRYPVLDRLLNRYLRLGDAVWETLEHNMNQPHPGTGDISTDLFGDPTLSYWGNPGGQSTLAAWPMLRYDARGQSYTTLTGPDIPVELWDYATTPPGTGTLPPSPVVSNNGEVIVAHGSYVDVLRQGTLSQRLALDATAYGTPAIAADGTIYAVDVNGRLYAFRYTSCFGHLCFAGDVTLSSERTLQWALDLGSPPTTSPVVGNGGFIAAGRSNAVVLVRPDGVKFRDFTVPGEPVGALTVGPDRAVYVSARSDQPVYDGYLARLDFYCPVYDLINGIYLCHSERFSASEYTSPLLAYGSLYVGQTDGRVSKLTAESLVQQATFQADGEITAGPVAGPGGQVLVGTANGTLYSLTKDLGLRWQRGLASPVQSVPAYSADALYLVSDGALRAYNPFSGAPLWSRVLDGGPGGGSVAVGYGREVYAQTSSGHVEAYGEGWAIAPLLALAQTVMVDEETPAIQVEWVRAVASSSAQTSDGHPLTVTPEGSGTGLLLQRSEGGGNWKDLAVLSPETGVYTDTGVLEDTGYAYRIQVLDSEGDDSDFTSTMAGVQSLPALPSAPTLISVTVEGAEALGLVWNPPHSDVVSAYRVERSLSQWGPFSTTLQTSGQVNSALDTGLEAGKTYTYRAFAANATGESSRSNMLSGTTRRRSLSAPENVTAALREDGRIRIDWTAGPEGASTEIEYIEGAMNDFEPLVTTGPSGPHTVMPGEPAVYLYRLKFVQGDAESSYTQAPAVVVRETWLLYLPLIQR